MRAVITSQLWFLDLQVYSMLVNVLNILLKHFCILSLKNVFESLIPLNTYLLENTKITDNFFGVGVCYFQVGRNVELCVIKSGNV